MAVKFGGRRGGGRTLGALWHAWKPPPATLALVACSVVLTAVGVWTKTWQRMVVSYPTSFQDLVPSFVTNTFINLGDSPIPLVIFMVITAFFFQDLVRTLWYTKRVELILGVIGFFVAFHLLNELVLPGAWGLATSVLVLSWFGRGAEQRWGPRRLLIFSLATSVTTNLVASGLLWLWPGASGALVGQSAGLPVGDGALVTALLTAWSMMLGHQRLMLLRIEGYKLVWVLVAFGVLEMLFTSAAVGVYTLSGVAVARLLIRGTWRPDRWIDELRLWRLRRRNAKRGAGLRVLPGGRDGRTLHRAPLAVR